MTDQLEIYYEYGHGDAPVFVSGGDEVDDLLERVRDKYEDRIVMEVSIAGSDDMDHMLVGVFGQRGVIFYSGPESKAFWSLDDSSVESGEVSYCYMGHERIFPANAEIEFETVKQATREFLASSGGRPACVDWQPYGPGYE